MHRLVQDIRFSLRVMWRRRLTSAAIILTLALGIGANAAVFRVLSATFLKPLPFANEESLVRLYVTPETGGAHISPRTPIFVELRDHATVFDSVAAQRFSDMTLQTDEGPERVTGISVSEGWAETLGIAPAIGRVFTQEEERLGISAPVALLSDPAWKSRFGSDPNILGRVVRLDGTNRAIVGVMGPSLQYPYEADFWVPMTPSDDTAATWGLNIQARLAPTASLASMNDELTRLSRTLPSVRDLEGMVVIGVPIREVLIDNEGTILFFLLAAVGFLLLIVAVNIANLLLAQSIARRKEFAIRTALGAGFATHARQLVTEGVLMGGIAGFAGLAIAWLGSSALNVLVPPDFIYIQQSVPFDYRVIVFGILLSLLTGAIFGSIPAFRAWRSDPAETLRDGQRATTAGGVARIGRIIVAIEVAATLVLLSGAGAMIEDIRQRQNLDLGYQPVNLLTMNVSLEGEKYGTREQRLAFLESCLANLATVPGVEDTGIVNTFPAPNQGTLLASAEILGRENRPGDPILVHNRVVHGSFFETMEMPLIAGRYLDERDSTSEAPVIVVSQSFASRHFPNEDVVGKQVRDLRAGQESPWRTIVGVVSDVEEFYADTTEAWYSPIGPETPDRLTGQAVFVIRTTVPPETLIADLRDQIWKVDPGMAVFDVETANNLYQESIAGNRSATKLTGVFAAMGLIIACVGVYGVMAFAMAQRTEELAIRMAVGGDRRRILLRVLGQSSVVLAVGLGAGAVGAWMFERWLSSYAAGVSIESAHIAVSGAILAVTAFVATYLPARRILRIDPGAILRSS